LSAVKSKMRQGSASQTMRDKRYRDIARQLGHRSQVKEGRRRVIGSHRDVTADPPGRASGARTEDEMKVIPPMPPKD